MIQMSNIVVLSFVFVNIIWSLKNYYYFSILSDKSSFRDISIKSPIEYPRKLLISNDHINTTKFLKHQINDLKSKLLYHESRVDHLKFQLQEILIADSKNDNIIIKDESFDIDKYLNNNSNIFINHRLNVDHSLLNYKKLKERSLGYWKDDALTPVMLGVLDELILSIFL
jgi:hypothetical protein